MPWTRWDGTNRARPFLLETDNVYTCREYISHGGYAAGETNDLVLNLKIPVDQTHRLHHKSAAINRFAQELSTFFTNINQHIADFDVNELPNWRITAMPSSKPTTDPGYDNRINKVCRQCCNIYKDIVFQPVLETIQARQPLHEGVPRSVETIMNNLSVPPDLTGVRGLFVVDDVLTQGTNIRAFSSKIQAAYADMRIISLVWAAAVFQEADIDEDIDVPF